MCQYATRSEIVANSYNNQNKQKLQQTMNLLNSLTELEKEWKLLCVKICVQKWLFKTNESSLKKFNPLQCRALRMKCAIQKQMALECNRMLYLKAIQLFNRIENLWNLERQVEKYISKHSIDLESQTSKFETLLEQYDETQNIPANIQYQIEEHPEKVIINITDISKLLSRQDVHVGVDRDSKQLFVSIVGANPLQFDLSLPNLLYMETSFKMIGPHLLSIKIPKSIHRRSPFHFAPSSSSRPQLFMNTNQLKPIM